MKTTLTILIAIICLNIQAQQSYTFKTKPRAQMTFWEKHSRTIGITAYHMATVAVGSLGDAMNDEGQKNLGHALKAVEVGMLISGPMIWKVQWKESGVYLATYVLHRVAEYDLYYGLYRDLGPMYNGGSSTWDKTMNTIPPHGRAFIKTFSFGMAIVIPINKL